MDGQKFNEVNEIDIMDNNCYGISRRREVVRGTIENEENR